MKKYANEVPKLVPTGPLLPKRFPFTYSVYPFVELYVIEMCVHVFAVTNGPVKGAILLKLATTICAVDPVLEYKASKFEQLKLLRVMEKI